MTMMMLRVAFSGDISGVDPERAAEELQRAGFQIYRFPAGYRTRFDHPLDDHIELTIEAPDDPKIVDAIWNEVDGIVHKYAGSCWEWGPVDRDYVPFAELFADRMYVEEMHDPLV
jgi:hypothetical protein